MIDARQRRIGLLVAGCFFMEIMDGTIVSTSAPRIGRALGVSSAAVGLVVTAYLVTLAVLIPMSGWLVSRLGVRRVFLASRVARWSITRLCFPVCRKEASSRELRRVLREQQCWGAAVRIQIRIS